MRLALTGLPDRIQGLLHLSQAVPPRDERRSPRVATNFLEVIGNSFIDRKQSLSNANIFLGQSLLSLWQFARGRARFQRSDIWHFIEVTGPHALPIVGLINILLMFPLLVLYADALGIFGGYLVGVGVLDLSTAEYIARTRGAIGISDITLGLVKGSLFGIVVAISGCMHGMQSGHSASAVGDAATSAVVSGIIAIIVMTAVFAVLTSMLNI